MLNPPNAARGTLSNFVEWREFIYGKSKELTRHMHKLILTNQEPNVLGIINVNVIREVYGALNEVEKQRILETEIFTQ